MYREQSHLKTKVWW